MGGSGYCSKIRGLAILIRLIHLRNEAAGVEGASENRPFPKKPPNLLILLKRPLSLLSGDVQLIRINPVRSGLLWGKSQIFLAPLFLPKLRLQELYNVPPSDVCRDSSAVLSHQNNWHIRENSASLIHGCVFLHSALDHISLHNYHCKC
jgi:hypothetical protein